MVKKKNVSYLKKKIYFKTYRPRIKKVNKINKIKIFVIFIHLIIIFIYLLIDKYRNNNISKKIEISSNKGYEQENKKFFDNLINKINNEEKYKGAKYCYYNDDDSCLYKYFCPKIVLEKKLKYFGIFNDGGYLLTDDLNNIKIAYSFGIDKELSFEMKVADSGIDVYMYDPTIQNLIFSKYKNKMNNFFENNIDYYEKKLHFFPIGITHSQNKNNNMKTLEELMTINGHLNESNMILKMDIEAAEWNILKELPDNILQKFKYMCFELHLGNKPEEYYSDVIKKLSKYHQVIFYRCNNWGGVVNFGYNRFCNCIELTYIIKKGNKFVRDNTIYPLKEFNYTNREGHDLDFDLNIFKLFYKE